MAINQNHLFEELNGVKCAIVEKNVSTERVAFLRRLLEHNGFTVVVVASPPAKAAPAAAPKAAIPAATPATNATAPEGSVGAASATNESAQTPAPPKESPGITPATPAAVAIAVAEEQAAPPAPPPPPETFTVGVTDVMFNPTNAIFGRLLKTPEGRVVTLAYWQQKESHSRDDVPYFNKQ
ncbi:MAG TPA: hypothetical protein VD993_18865 [Chitinophagaceae bacterium]|nr:hypothetical protein [Chitinophagaceae bacterium]